MTSAKHITRLFALSLALSLALSCAAGCTKGGPSVDRTQPNLVDEDLFEGEWWVAQTVIEADADASGPTWTGDMGWADLAIDNNG
ncbi:MAG: hypothetical protein DRH23_16445, partial [Deltaproteobacteria bacterium]